MLNSVAGTQKGEVKKEPKQAKAKEAQSGAPSYNPFYETLTRHESISYKVHNNVHKSTAAQQNDAAIQKEKTL